MKKHYRIVLVDMQTPPVNMETFNSTPSAAAKKIFSLLKKHKKKNQHKRIEVAIQDITRNSSTKGKIYNYSVEKIKIKPVHVTRGDRLVSFTYKTVATKI